MKRPQEIELMLTRCDPETREYLIDLRSQFTNMQKKRQTDRNAVERAEKQVRDMALQNAILQKRIVEIESEIESSR